MKSRGFFETLGECHNVGLSLIAAELVISVTVLYHTLNGWSGPKVILTFQIFAYLSLREDLREASTVGIISPQLVLPCLSHRHFKTHHRMVQSEIKYYRGMKFAKNAYTLVVQYYICSSTR